MMQNIQLVLTLAQLLSSIIVCHSIIIYVDHSALNEDCSETSSTNPCNNLSAALNLIVTDTSPNLQIASGSYILPPLSRYTFKSISDVFTMNGNGEVVIDCDGSNSGFGFIQVKNINISGITLLGCGIEQNSTALNLSSELPVLSFVPVPVALYFEGCRTVSLLSIAVKSSSGLAVQFYSTSGRVEIMNSIFSGNNPVGTRWGGGVYIEFPFCKPGNSSCHLQNTSSVDISSVSDSNYVIRNCVFENNYANDPEKYLLVLAYRFRHDPAGRGGGLSVFFKGNATNNLFEIDNCTFQNNTAVYGGGIYMEMQDSATNNSVLVSDSKFINNHAKKDGGGILASYLFLKTLTGDEVIMSNIRLTNVTFENNVASFIPHLGTGGGVSYTTTRQSDPAESVANKFSITRSYFHNNTAFVGSALQISSYIIANDGYLYHVFVSDIQIRQNTVDHSDNVAKQVGSGALFISEVPVKISVSGKFVENNGTALAVYNSKLFILENALIEFDKNRGFDGGALLLHSSAVLVLYENVTVNFYENIAFNRGGAIFANYISPIIGIESQNCFIQYHDRSKRPSNWNVRFIFRSNSDTNGNSIYASSLLPCILGNQFGIIDETNKEELLSNVFCWNDVSIIWNYGDNNTADGCKKHIGSSLHFDQKSSPLMLNVTPGNITAMNLGGVNDQGEKIASNVIVHAYSLDKDDGVTVDSDYTYISDDNIRLKNTKNVNKTVIHLDTVGQELTMTTDIQVTFLECPLGFHNVDGVCVCSGKFGGVLNCNDSFFTATLLSGYWIGTSNCAKHNDTIIVSHCKYCNYKSVKDGYYELNKTLDEIQKDLCGNNRKGHICSFCEDGYAPAINIDHNECVKCDGNHKIWGTVLFLALDILVPLLFLVLLYVIDVPLTNGLLHGPIFFAQMITTVISLDADDIIQYSDIVGHFDSYFEIIYTTLYDVFNLEFFMFLQEFCIGLHRFAYMLALQYIAAILPMVLVFLIGILIFWFDRSSRCRCEIMIKSFVQTRFKNISNILATCLLLSYTKVAVLTCYLLTPISLVSANGKFGDYSHSVLYVDGSICYPSHDFIPYLALSLAAAAVFLVPIPIFLFLFRSNNDANMDSGIFNNLLDQFQKEFRCGEDDFQSRFPIQRPDCAGKKSKDDSTCCNPCKCGIYNRTEYTYECCTRNYMCQYYMMRSRYCRIVINTSFSLYDFRWLSCGLFVLRILLILPYLFAWTTVIRYCIQFTICMFAGMMILIFQPYKPKIYKYVDCNRVEAFSLFNMAFILSLCIYQYHYTTTKGLNVSLWVYVLQCILVMIPFVWIVCVYIVLVKERHREKYDKYIKPCLLLCCGKPDMVRREDNDLSHPLLEEVETESYRLSERSDGTASNNSLLNRDRSEYSEL